MQEKQTERNWEKEGWGHEDLGTRHRGSWELIICAEKKYHHVIKHRQEIIG